MNNHHEDDSPYGTDQASASEIVTFPASVQARLDEARDLLRQDRPGQALAALQHAGAELARSSPELFALIVAAPLGVRRVVVEEEEVTRTTVQNDRHKLGIRVGHDVQTTTVRKATRRTFRLE